MNPLSSTDQETTDAAIDNQAAGAPEPEHQPAPESASLSSPGAWLKQAREDAGLSAEQVAKDLFLDTRIIRALEVDRYQDVGAPVYAKGYLRRYAKLLGVTENAVISRYDALQGTPAVADPVPTSHNKIPAPRPPLAGWVWWSVVAVVLLAGVIVLLNLRDESAVVAGSSPRTVPVTMPASANTPLAQAALPIAADNAAAQTAPDQQQATTENAAPQAAAMVSVQLRFSENSWVEIYDVGQKTVLYDMGTPNSTRSVQGSAPLRVTLGSASSVAVSINGVATSVPAANIQANVAHFNINAAGHIE